jgi:hypothetical chaperone protein
MSKNHWYAIDFGTSNSLLSHIHNGESKLINLEDGNPILRSLLYTPEQREWYFGEEAISMREENDGEGRFFRSIKKFLPEARYKGTEVHGRILSIEKLVAVFLKAMKERADKEVGTNVTNVVLGRPARYSLDDKSDQLAEDRMRKAAEIAGFKNIVFCPEPLAAGLNISRSQSDELVMIADFGGGTSDFTILKVTNEDYDPSDVLGLSGVFLAGDALDGTMMKDFISPHFGSLAQYKTAFSDNILSFPRKLIKTMCSPAHIGVLRVRETWELMKEIQSNCVNDEFKRQFEQLFTLVEEQLAYPIYRQIENTKIELSTKESSTFVFKESNIDITEEIDKGSYSDSVAETIEKIKASMMESFEDKSLTPNDIHRVYITGGTGQSPYIQEMLKDVFGEKKISSGEVYQSVINGLAEYAKTLE